MSINGWVRSRRDSKAGFSFINLHDGSCFDGIQLVADAELEAGVTNEINFNIGETDYTVTLGKDDDKSAVVVMNKMDTYQDAMKARLESIEWI